MAAGSCGNPTSPSRNPNLIVRLTDDHIDDVDQVNLFFTDVTVKPVGRPVETLSVALATNPQDLLVLQDSVVTLATGLVEPGEYEFIRLNIDDARSSVVEGGLSKRLRTPSEQIRILGRFTVGEGGVTTVTLDFDAEESLVHLGNGDWLLKPVIAMSG
jgi:hypothetical protein